MSSQMKYQVDMFMGPQSFIFRTNSAKSILTFTGIKKLNSESIKNYLCSLNDFKDGPAVPDATTTKANSKSKTKEISQSGTPLFSGGQQMPNYLDQVRMNLEAMGYKTEKQQVAMLKKLPYPPLKNLKHFPRKGNLSPIALQTILGLVIREQVKNGKR